MKILYFSDKYAYNVMGTKRSIEEETRSNGHEVVYYTRSNIKNILNIIKKENPNQIWLSHSGLSINPEIKRKINIPVIGFGFSDPYSLKDGVYNYIHDGYITNHYETMEKLKSKLPVHYNPTACDFRFHKKSDIKKDLDISSIGVGVHPRFHNKNERIDFMNKLRKDTKFSIECYGSLWNKHPKNYGQISGDKFLNVIWRSRIGLDIQDDWSPLAHRMFEYIACGTPVITRERSEVIRVFKPGKEILTYTNFIDLKEKLEYYLNDGYNELLKIVEAGYQRCCKDHNIDKRVKAILNFVSQLKGDNHANS